MTTNLQLCQRVARDSKTVSGVLPTTVAGQVGRLATIVAFVTEAHEMVQNLHRDWRFLQKEGTGALTAGTDKYTDASFASLTDWAEWTGDDNNLGYYPVSIYLTATGVVDETRLKEIPYGVWYRRWGQGTPDAGRPIEYAISPRLELCFGPCPDAAYSLKYWYKRTPFTFSSDTDVPLFPERFHEIIKWEAMRMLAETDEAAVQIAAAERNYKWYLTELRRNQLPVTFVASNPLA